MTCPSFGSSSEVSLWYAADADIVINSLGAASQLSATATAWKPIPLTGESLAANLTSTVSEQITANRSYANSVLSGGEVSGTINFEAQANDFLYDMLICATQNAAKTSFEPTGTAWAAAAAIKNASTKHCFAILRRVAVASGYDWYVYRGCQVGGMTLEIGTGALISGTINITGVRPDTVIESAATVSGWTYGSLVDTPLMSGPYSLREFSISTWNGSIWGPSPIAACAPSPAESGSAPSWPGSRPSRTAVSPASAWRTSVAISRRGASPGPNGKKTRAWRTGASAAPAIRRSAASFAIPYAPCGTSGRCGPSRPLSPP